MASWLSRYSGYSNKLASDKLADWLALDLIILSDKSDHTVH